MVVGERVAGRYELEELVGTGGMSSVYRAHDTMLDRKVALKVLHAHYTDDDEYVERFRREARSVAQLSHPNIVTVIDRGEEDGSQFIVFEYIGGDNLKELVSRSGAMPVATAVSLAHQIARALAFAHENGLVHRDVKPQNVLLNGDGRAKVTDFGIARSLDVKHGMTQTGTVLGTSDYIAPEQAQGQTISAQTDVYSLGVVLWELLTGEVPFPGENFVAVAMRHINEAPPHVRDRRPDVSPRLDAALQRAMAKDPRDRFPSMDAFCAELAACLQELEHGQPDEGATVIVPPGPRRPPPQRSRSRVPWLPIALAALLAAAAVAAAVIAWQRSHDSNGGTPHVTPPAQVHLSGVGAFDPFGGDGEHDSEAPLATDSDPQSAWTTQHYRDAPSLGKPGVGLVLDAGRQVTLSQLGIATDTPGFTAVIRVGDSPDGPSFRTVSAAKTVEGNTLFDLKDATARYFVVWITRLSSSYDYAHVNAVSAR
jgi:eukaryotic-like serine/threonine-protein kinase